MKAMIIGVALGLAALGAAPSIAEAGTLTIDVQKEVAVSTTGAYGNLGWNHAYDWVGTGEFGNFSSIFGFDLSSLPKNATITDITFSAYHNYTGNVANGASSDNATVGAAIGTSNDWNPNSITEYNTFGNVLAQLDENSSNLNMYQTWNLGAVSATNGYLTVDLMALSKGWNDYQPVTGNPALGAYLTVSYTSAVPELSTWVMMLAGFAGLGFVAYRRNQVALTLA